MSNKEKVVAAYASGKEAHRAKETGAYGMEFINTKKVLNPYISKDKTILEIGCGGGYYGIHYAKSCLEYTGIDLSPVNISAFQKEIQEKGLNNVKAEVGDATNLIHTKDNSYDVVLCLGPMYHLTPEERVQCMRECARVCKKGGVIAFAFINKTGAIAKYAPVMGWDNVMTEKVEENVMTKGIDDILPDVFFYTMPEEMRENAIKVDLTCERFSGLDFLITEEVIEQFSEEQRKAWFHFSDLVFGSEYCTGLANHAILICKK